MNFGTLKYDLMMKNFATKLRPRRKKKVIDKKKVVKSISQIQQTEENLLINEPKLPENWVKTNTITGDESYDQTVNNIRLQLKSTIVSIYFITSLKRLYF